MTLGEHPEKVPRKYFLPTGLFRSQADVGRFENLAMAVGLGARDPNLGGGSVFDDFNGDGPADLFTTESAARGDYDNEGLLNVFVCSSAGEASAVEARRST
jgi:hypothetical protein